ncbi:hypothetical protein Q4488_01740 [Amphritea sp. 1_MG-2023]|uniref:NifB/NifX family molybdenum-iron cluster-binding protein n=1 Tax=Amphritea sp. 1_MG-2023 TaxID=3062670 RepID=UPI0026E24CCA|nr:hypothetical protein [Amphritea sp. 1_MG-2023]MDO6562091.1 hypothetical protein [Amphritea sp. 1_MG-2023]
MKIAVASRDGVSVTDRVGKCKSWIVFQADISPNSPSQAPRLKMLELISLPKPLVFHHYKNDVPHPLADCDALIGGSAGECFISQAALLGVEAFTTDQSDPVQAVKDYLKHHALPIAPHVIGELGMNSSDLLSSGH